jgi:hypothetical protein
MKSVVCLAAVVLAGVAHASGPIGVYALVDKVTFEPNVDNPERIRISGVFITALETPDNSTVYSAPQRGYLYFRLPKGTEELARREWADLKSVAGKLQVVGLGASWGAKVHVWKTDTGAMTPEDYPMGNGMVTVNADQPRARALLDYRAR